MPKRTAQQVLHDQERVEEERMKELAEKLEELSPAELQDFLQDLYSSMQEDTENPHGVWVNKEKSYIILELFYEEGCRHIRYDYKTETLADGPRAQTIYRRCLPPKPGDPVEFLAMVRHEMVDCVSLICKDAANVLNVTNAQQCVDTVTSCVYALYATSASITCEDEPFKSHWKKLEGGSSPPQTILDGRPILCNECRQKEEEARRQQRPFSFPGAQDTEGGD